MTLIFHELFVRIATITPKRSDKKEDSSFNKVRAGIKRYIAWIFREELPFLYGFDITSRNKPWLLHNSCNQNKILDFKEGAIPKRDIGACEDLEEEEENFSDDPNHDSWDNIPNGNEIIND